MGSIPARRRFAQATAAAWISAGLIAVPAAVAGEPSTSTGPSTSTAPYVLPIASGVRTRSILTVGDTVDGYTLVGIPDGLGLLEDEDALRLFATHELASGVGIGRAHGGTGGAFVSQWSIDGDDLGVVEGSDLIRTAYFWNATTGAYETRTGASANFNRFCSADLPAKTALWDPRSRTGYNGRVFFSGEEAGDEGRAFAHLVTGSAQGTSHELPALGKSSWENLVASPAGGHKTVMVGLDDSTPGQVYVYVGEKQRHGSALERAGLTGGSLFGIAVPGAPTADRAYKGITYAGASVEDRMAGVNGASVPFHLHEFGDVTSWTGEQLQVASMENGVTEFLRPEDGAWDPRNPNDFYFVTTDRFETSTQVGNSRLWRLRFDDVHDPASGGTLSMLLDGTEGPQMMDNLTVDRHGNVLIQEDPGNQAYLARVWSYSIATDTLTAIAEHDPALFTPGAAGFLTQDEESSGVIDASSVLGSGWFLATDQVHKAIGGELVEMGQLYAIYNPASDPGR